MNSKKMYSVLSHINHLFQYFLRFCQRNKHAIKFLIYFCPLLLYGIFAFNLLSNSTLLQPSGDDGLIIYTIIRHIKKLSSLDFSNWFDMKIFFPNQNTIAYTDHFYLHSLIGAPFYLITKDALKTYDFIFFVQMIIGALGFYKLAQKFTTNTWIILISGFYFLYLPAFIFRHPQINFYAFLPWVFYYLIQFVKTRKIKFLYFATIFILLQLSVGIYLQLFFSLFLSLFFLISILYLKQKKKLGSFFTKKLILNYILSFSILLIVLVLINLPYILFKLKQDSYRSLNEVSLHSADIVQSYFTPNKHSSFYDFLDDIPKPQSPESYLFIGVSGIFILMLSWLTSSLISLDKKFVRFIRSKHTLLICSIFLFLMFIFSLGPFLKINGLTTSIKLPYFLIYKLLFVFKGIRVPSRIIVIMSLPLSLLLLFWLNEFYTRKEISKKAKYSILLFSTIIVFLDVYKSLPTRDCSEIVKQNYVYSHINNNPGVSLLELPSGISCKNLGSKESCQPGVEGDDGYYEFMHIYHNKWLVNGYSGYYPQNTLSIIQTIDLNYDSQDVLSTIIKQHKIDIILIHKKRIHPNFTGQFTVLSSNLKEFMNIAYEDHNYILYTSLLRN